jgi:ribulose bisphosphate carboxylase small subunit
MFSNLKRDPLAQSTAVQEDMTNTASENLAFIQPVSDMIRPVLHNPDQIPVISVTASIEEEVAVQKALTDFSMPKLLQTLAQQGWIIRLEQRDWNKRKSVSRLPKQWHALDLKRKVITLFSVESSQGQHAASHLLDGLIEAIDQGALSEGVSGFLHQSREFKAAANIPSSSLGFQAFVKLTPWMIPTKDWDFSGRRKFRYCLGQYLLNRPDRQNPIDKPVYEYLDQLLASFREAYPEAQAV